jgi:hypothetical protein
MVRPAVAEPAVNGCARIQRRHQDRRPDTGGGRGSRAQGCRRLAPPPPRGEPDRALVHGRALVVVPLGKSDPGHEPRVLRLFARGQREEEDVICRCSARPASGSFRTIRNTGQQYSFRDGTSVDPWTALCTGSPGVEGLARNGVQDSRAGRRSSSCQGRRPKGAADALGADAVLHALDRHGARSLCQRLQG